jgi:hypothetical protein
MKMVLREARRKSQELVDTLLGVASNLKPKVGAALTIAAFPSL